MVLEWVFRSSGHMKLCGRGPGPVPPPGVESPEVLIFSAQG